MLKVDNPQQLSMASHEKLTCILHLDCTACSESIKTIDSDKWKTITDTVCVRKSWQKETKYDHLLANFPESLQPTFGYHSKCYKNFTAVPKALREASKSESTSTSGPKPTRAESRNQSGSSSGVLDHKCIFCNSVKHNNKKVVTSLDPKAEIKIRLAAKVVQDQALLLKIGAYAYGEGRDFTALEAHYHKACYRKFLNKARPSTARKDKKLKKRASVAVLNYVDNLVVKQNIPTTASYLVKKYKDLFLSYGGDPEVLDGYLVQSMCRKLEKHIGKAITITSNKEKTGSVVFKTGAMTLDEATRLVSI